MDIRKYLNELVSNSFYPTLKNISDVLASRIEKAIQNKENPTNFTLSNSEDISNPIVEAQKEATRAFKEIKLPEPIPVDFSELSVKLDALKTALVNKEMVVNQGNTKVDVDTKSVVKAIEKLEKSMPKMEKQEVIDYTLMMDEMMKILEKPHYSLELLRIQEILNKISEKKIIPEELITKDGIKVVGLNRSLGRSVAYETVWQKNVAGDRINPATEDKQDDIITADNDKLHKYKLSDIDDTSDPNYLGYLSKDGAWYIQRISSTGEVRYAKGDSGYNWSNRASETYNTFDNIF